MDKLVLFDANTLEKLLNKRPNESKFGEQIQLPSPHTSIYESLVNLDVSFVILGIPEDVGVLANFGKSGTANTWEATLKVLLNIQSNNYTQANRVLILGHLDFKEEMEKVRTLDLSIKKDLNKSRKIVAKIDKHVTDLIYQIKKAGKTPIVIGGGHNNAYGNIKGCSLALKKPINAINFDAHTDFRSEEGRHSGNGFTYAYTEGFLKKYFIFGLHENYTSSTLFKIIDKLKSVDYNTYESVAVRKEWSFNYELTRALKFISEKPFGIEIDCDAIINIPSSAMTPSGFSVEKARAFVNYMGTHKNATYLHICEAASTPETEAQIGKLISYLITDFIRAQQLNISEQNL